MLKRLYNGAACGCRCRAERAAPEAKNRDAIVRLVEEGQGSVVNKHCALQVSAKARQVLDAGVGWAGHCSWPVQAMLERPILALQPVSNGTRIVL